MPAEHDWLPNAMTEKNWARGLWVMGGPGSMGEKLKEAEEKWLNKQQLTPALVE